LKVDTDDASTGYVAEHAGKYRALHDWLRQQTQDQIPMSFEAIEDVLGLPLPASAKTPLAHWYSYEGTALGRAIQDAEWKATGSETRSCPRWHLSARRAICGPGA
jgi:hypothetical protein